MKVGRSKEIPREPVAAEGARGAGIQWLLGKKDRVPHFYMRLVTVDPDGVIPLHQHEVIHEMFIVKGKGAVLHPDGETSVNEGDFIYMPSMEIHGTRNTGTEPLQFICCINISPEK
jgi:quercetin dioxygenase-like cupin family protein